MRLRWQQNYYCLTPIFSNIMAKTETEILDAHKRTIEVLTGKKCEITLVGKEEQILKEIPLNKMMIVVNGFSLIPIVSKGSNADTVMYRKIFCLLAFHGHTQRAIKNSLNIHLDTVRYYLRNGKILLQNNNRFKQQYEQVKSTLLSGY